MADYEITYVSDPKLEEEARGQLDSAVDSKINEFQGTVSYTSPNLRRRLAYPLQKQTNAFVRSVQAELDSQHISTFRDWLKKQIGVFRVTILQTARRQEIPADIVERVTQKQSSKTPNKVPARPAKKVTMEAVEKGIEEALKEEVK
jgi:ribosomal protein S6